MLVHYEGPEGKQRIVLGKTAEGFYAFGDHCTHKGGPLCDGALAGSHVQCPWHGSQFDVHTGSVVSGPASAPIKTFRVNEREGEVCLSTGPAAVIYSPTKKKAS